MNLRLGVLTLAVLTATAMLSAPTPAANAGVDITPPEVGSCHDLTWKEAGAADEPDPAVDCTEPHTAVTTKIVNFAQAPDWDDAAKVWAKIEAPCSKAALALFDGRAKPLLMSAYITFFFYPTEGQRDAGAKWVRCDIGLASGRALRRLPTDGPPELGALPLPKRVARCRAGKAAGYALTTCDKNHAFRATHAVKHPGTRYPGYKRLARWTLRKCGTKISGPFYWEGVGRGEWRAGLRYSVCLKKTSN